MKWWHWLLLIIFGVPVLVWAYVQVRAASVDYFSNLGG